MLSPGDIRRGREWCRACDDLTVHTTEYLGTYDGVRAWSWLRCECGELAYG